MVESELILNITVIWSFLLIYSTPQGHSHGRVQGGLNRPPRLILGPPNRPGPRNLKGGGVILEHLGYPASQKRSTLKSFCWGFCCESGQQVFEPQPQIVLFMVGVNK